MREARGRGTGGGDWVNYFNRFNDLLEMEHTRPASAEELATMGVGVTTAV
jgi:hypothetical protein